MNDDDLEALLELRRAAAADRDRRGDVAFIEVKEAKVHDLIGAGLAAFERMHQRRLAAERRTAADIARTSPELVAALAWQPNRAQIRAARRRRGGR